MKSAIPSTVKPYFGHPPHGGCGLKYIVGFTVEEKLYGHPPHGGCGLKLSKNSSRFNTGMSPSTRRVWIEIKLLWATAKTADVTLHTEGVD